MKKRRNRRYRLLIFFILIIFLAAAHMALTATGLPEQDENTGSIDADIPEEVVQSAENAGHDISDYPEALLTLYIKNPDARQFVLDYFSVRDTSTEIDLSEYADCTSVPLFMQWDERWGYTEYSGNLFGLSGCGPTCLSMVAIYLTGDTSLTPRYMADFSTENGYAVNGNGTSWTLFSEGSASLGLTAQELPLSESVIDSHLASGEPVVCIMGPGDFTDSGHFIVLTGIADGEYTVNDPNSFANSERTWSYDDISGQIRNLWAFAWQ